MKIFMILLWREWLLIRRGGGFVMMPSIFYLMTAFVFSFLLNGQPNLTAVMPMILWCLAMLAVLLHLSDCFAPDQKTALWRDLMLNHYPLSLYALIKCCGAFVAVALPIVILAAIFAGASGAAASDIGRLLLGLLAGLPFLIAIGLFAASLTLAAKGGALLQALLIIPLYIPTLIFGVSAATNPAASAFALNMLCGLSFAAMTLTPFAIAAALRQYLSR